MIADVFGAGRKQIEAHKDVNLLKGEKLPKQLEKVEPFCFVQAADTQFGLIDRYLKKLEKPGWEDEIATAEQLVEACNKMNPAPKFIIICGDIVDAWPEQSQLREAQVRDVKRVLSKVKLDIPLVCLCGNHDIGNEPTMEAVDLYKRTFGEDYFYFVVNEILFIVLNSQFYQHRAFVEDYATKQDEWLDSILTKCKYFNNAIIFQHVPWFLENPNEQDDYFNIEKSVRMKWLSKFEKFGIKKIMCGHYHKNAGGWFSKKLELVVTSAVGAQLGNDQSGARVVKVLSDGTIKHKYYALQDLPGHIELE